MLHAQRGGKSSRLSCDETAWNDTDGGKDITVAADAASADQKIVGMEGDERAVWNAVAFAWLVVLPSEKTFMLFEHFARRLCRMYVCGKVVATDFIGE